MRWPPWKAGSESVREGRAPVSFLFAVAPAGPPAVSSLAMLYMIIEHYKNGDPLPVYRRFHERGLMAPEGLRYVSSWVTTELAICYQVMECDDRRLLDAWIGNWSDLVDFDVILVLTSVEVAVSVKSRL